MTQPSVRFRIALLVGIFSTMGPGCEEESHPTMAQAAPAAPQPPPQPPTRKNLPRSAEWKRVEALISEQKYEEARALCRRIREASQKSGNTEEWTEALIKETQLQIGLSGFETAVRFLRTEPWPKDLLSQVALELYYANSLVQYLQAYSWEISQRERVATKGEVDLKVWSKDQIYGEAQAAYARLWAHRAELSQARLDLLGGALGPGTYPAHVRGTLRDELSYFAAELLTNTQFYRPEESNELYRLDWKSLLEGRPVGSEPGKLDDSKLHPLVRAMAVLDDLERFHTEQRHPEAALEARLFRVRRLQQLFTDASERDQLIAHLEQRLPIYRAHPWWSMGMAALAELLRDGPQDLGRAYAVAAEGQRAYPNSPGGAACLYIQKTLEAPDFQLQAMGSDGPGKRSLLVSHKNVDRLYFRAYAVDLIQRIESTQDYELLVGQTELAGLVKEGRPVAEWTADLPPTPDYKLHQTYVTPPLKQNGLYAIVASLRSDFAEADNRVLGVNLILTDLMLVTRQSDAQLEVTVVSASSGQPVSGATVTLYQHNYNRRHQRVASERTDAQGVVRLQKGDGQSYYVMGQNGRDATVDPNSYYLYRGAEQKESQAALVYTDRSIYRPGQKLYYKAVAYRGKQEAGRFELAPRVPLVVVLRDANGQPVAQKELVSNDFGTAAGEFTIPSGRLLGGWLVEVRGANAGSSAIRVEEYKRPTFEVSFKDPESPLRLNKPATLIGEARYFFGQPVTAGKLHFRVSREPVYPWWWFAWGLASGGEGSQTVASGDVLLEKGGSFRVQFTPAADERLGRRAKEVSYRYVVKADLTDEGGETRSAERSFRLGFVSVEASVEPGQGFAREGGGGVLTVRRTSLDGVPRPGEGRYRIVAIKPPGQPGAALLPADQPVLEPPSGEARPYRTPGDKLRPRWQPGDSPEAALGRFLDGAEKHSGKLVHDSQGVATLSLPPLPPGPYRLRYETKDDFGEKAEAWKDFVVAPNAPAGPAAMPLAMPLLLRSEKVETSVGDKARLLLASGLPEQPVVLEIFRSGKLLRRSLYRGSALIEIPIGEEDRGGFGVLAWTVADHQYLAQSLSIQVPWTNKELKLEFATFRDKLRPGSRETWKVIVRSANGEALSRGMAELLAYMYDRSLDLFAPHQPANPLGLYPFRGNFTRSRSSAGAAPVHWVHNRLPSPVPPEPLRGASLVFYDSYAIGGLGNRFYGVYGGAPVQFAQAALVPGSPPPPPPPPPPAKNAPSTPAARALPKGLSTALADQKNEADKDVRTRGPAKYASNAQATEGDATAVRKNFAETAFFLPSLVTDADGSATLEFQVPDSVTSWNVWVHAITRDLRAGSLRKEARSIKDLLVRPYLPRFFREADSAKLKVMVNNAGTERPLSGTLRLEIFDPETQEDLLPLFQIRQAEQPFTVEPGKGATLTYALSAPRRVGTYAFKLLAKAGDLSDGELRPLPVLPSRMHLVESRFVTLHDKDRRTMSFADLAKNDDPTRVSDRLVVTLDAQLFYTVLKALPYLQSYPYECVEQTLNRFLSTGIVTSVFGQYPAVARMAREFASRKVELERWDAPDPNRKMALEESPWLNEAQGGRGGKDDAALLINALDPAAARSQRDSALAKLEKAQTSLGGFPWFPGGPPSPFMTLYLMHGFAKASEFQVSVPKPMVQRGWQYLARHFREHYAGCLKKNECDWEFLTFLNYVATAYPDASWTGGALTDKERQEILAYSFSHWKQHTPYLKALLALSLKRMGQKDNARLVWQSIMDSAKSAPDQGVFFAPEDRSWLWYSDTIESHAFALRALMELEPENAKKDGLVLWLLINKKLNQWKSTRATAEVIYSLVHYLKREGALGVREEATVTLGPAGELGRESFVFSPDKYTGKVQLVVPGEQLAKAPAAASSITVEKTTKGHLFASATWHYSTDRLPSQGRGDFFRVERTYWKRELDAKTGGKDFVLRPLAEGELLRPGDEVEVHLSLRSKHAAEYVHLRDPRAAGMEPDNNVSRYRYDLGLTFYEEVRDSGMNFFFEQLPAGEYTLKYRLRVNLAGSFRVGPATVQSMYAPEFSAFSAGHTLTIAD